MTRYYKILQDITRYYKILQVYELFYEFCQVFLLALEQVDSEPMNSQHSSCLKFVCTYFRFQQRWLMGDGAKQR